MKKMFNFVRDYFIASKYAIAFCYKSTGWGTILRVILSFSISAFAYLVMQSTGYLVSTVQEIFKSEALVKNVSDNLFENTLFWPIVFFTLSSLILTVVTRIDNYQDQSWFQLLRIKENRARFFLISKLDAATIKSKLYDNVTNKIDKLPGAWNARAGYAKTTFINLQTIITFLLYGTTLIVIKPYFAIVIILSAIPFVVLELVENSKWYKAYDNMVPVYKIRSSYEKPFRSTAGFIQSVIFGQFPYLMSKIDETMTKEMDTYNALRKRTTKIEIYTNFLINSAICVLVFITIRDAVLTRGNIGMMTVVISSLMAFKNSFVNITLSLSDQILGSRSVICLEEDFYSLKPELETKKVVSISFEKSPVIDFRNVNFIYPEDETRTNVLNNVNLKISSGQKVAIVGQSGNGKSTLSNLLTRVYDPSDGDILIDDISLKAIAPNEWYKTITTLNQEISFREGLSIGEEIASSRMDIPVDMVGVKWAAKMALFDSVILDKGGYDAIIGTSFGGTDFSGGEKQRLVLAMYFYRIYKGAKIVVFDEPDTGLDPETAGRLIDNIFSLKDVTVILITHHVSLARRCDKAILLGKGSVVEEGSHEMLMANGREYASLYRMDVKRVLGVCGYSEELV